MRMGAASAIVVVHADQTALRLAYIWDLCWMTVILLLTVRKALCGGKGEAPGQDMVSPLDQIVTAADDQGEQIKDNAKTGGGGLQARLVQRVLKQAADGLQKEGDDEELKENRGRRWFRDAKPLCGRIAAALELPPLHARTRTRIRESRTKNIFLKIL